MRIIGSVKDIAPNASKPRLELTFRRSESGCLAHGEKADLTLILNGSTWRGTMRSNGLREVYVHTRLQSDKSHFATCSEVFQGLGLAHNDQMEFEVVSPDTLRLVMILSAGDGAIIQDLSQFEQEQNVDPTTRKALIDARLGQGNFRAKVLQAWDGCCSVTGSTIQAAIRASHIKPWRESSNAERLDPENGLSLIASLDALFDAGLISFDASGKLIVSQNLSMKERAIFGIGDRSLKRKPTAQMAEYLAHHRAMNGL